MRVGRQFVKRVRGEGESQLPWRGFEKRQDIIKSCDTSVLNAICICLPLLFSVVWGQTSICIKWRTSHGNCGIWYLKVWQSNCAFNIQHKRWQLFLSAHFSLSSDRQIIERRYPQQLNFLASKWSLHHLSASLFVRGSQEKVASRAPQS